MTFNRPEYIVDELIILASIIIVLIAQFTYGINILNGLLSALGTGLFASGITSLIFHRYHSEDEKNNILVMAETRTSFGHKYDEFHKNAKEIDILSVGLKYCLGKMANNSDEELLKKIVFNNQKIRIVFLNPFSDYVIEQRASDDGIPGDQLRLILLNSLIQCKRIYQRIKKLNERSLKLKLSDKSSIGALDIRVINTCSQISYSRYDDRVLWGINPSFKTGSESPVLYVNSKNIFYMELSNHFNSIWNRIPACNYVLQYHDGGHLWINDEFILKAEKVLSELEETKKNIAVSKN